MGNTPQNIINNRIVDSFNGVLSMYGLKEGRNFMKLEANIFQGTVSIKNILLEKKHFSFLDMPLDLKHGVVGEVKFECDSYLDFLNQNKTISVSRVFICFEIRDSKDWNKETIKKLY
jgi:hypothetical protein